MIGLNATEVNLLEQYIKQIKGRNGLKKQEYAELIGQQFPRNYDIRMAKQLAEHLHKKVGKLNIDEMLKMRNEGILERAKGKVNPYI